MKTIEQTVEFTGLSPSQLFETYMDSEQHAAAINAPASIERRAGGAFRAFGDKGLRGTILHVVPNRMVVQTWRSQTQWKATEPDSILVLNFEKTANGARLVLVHSGIPDRDFELFNQGWQDRYWNRWRLHFASKG